MIRKTDAELLGALLDCVRQHPKIRDSNASVRLLSGVPVLEIEGTTFWNVMVDLARLRTDLEATAREIVELWSRSGPSRQRPPG